MPEPVPPGYIAVECAACVPPCVVYVSETAEISKPYVCTACMKRARHKIENATEPWVGRVKHGERYEHP